MTTRSIVHVDTDYLPMWPLVVCLEDCYVPELAAQAMEVAEGCSDEFLATAFESVARYAADQLYRQRN